MIHYLVTYYDGHKEDVMGYNFLMALSCIKGHADEILSVVKLDS